MNESTITLHLGMSKTGTTFLQQRLFPVLPGVHFYDQPRTNKLNGGPYQGLLARAFKRSPALWNDIGDELYSELIKEGDFSGSGKIVLISDQSAGPAMFEAEPYSGHYLERERNRADQFCSHIASLSNIAKKYGASRVRVILIFRRQDDWLASKYAQRSNRIKNASQKHFETRIRSVIDPADRYYTDGVVLNYYYLWQKLVDTVGEENLLMLPYEWFNNAPSEYLTAIAEFITSLKRSQLNRVMNSVDIHQINVRSVSKNTWQLRRSKNKSPVSVRLRPARLFKKLGFPIRVPLTMGDRGLHDEISLSPRLRDEIMGKYKDTNRKLSLLLGIDLKNYGYY